MEIRLGGLTLAVAHRGTWFFAGLAGGREMILYRQQRRKGAPLLDHWREENAFNLRIWRLTLEAVG